MSAYVLLECDGCEKTEKTKRFRRDFHSFNGKGYGFGRYSETTAHDLVDETDWVFFDQYTGATYCKECWASITRQSEADVR